MTKQETIQSRVDKIVNKIEAREMNWKAIISGSNGVDYTIPEASSKEEFVAALTRIITEIVEAELEE